MTTTRGEDGFTVTWILSIKIPKEIALRLFCNSFAARVAVERKCHLGKGRKRVKPDRPAATHCSFHHHVPPSSVISRLAAWLYSSLSRSLSLPLFSLFPSKPYIVLDSKFVRYIDRDYSTATETTYILVTFRPCRPASSETGDSVFSLADAFLQHIYCISRLSHLLYFTRSIASKTRTAKQSDRLLET